MIGLNDHGVNSGFDAQLDIEGKKDKPAVPPLNNYDKLVSIVMLILIILLAVIAILKQR